MKFKFKFKLFDSKLNEVECSFASKDYKTEEQAVISAKVALKDKENARFAEIFQYKYIRGFQKDCARIARITKDKNTDEMKYFGL